MLRNVLFISLEIVGAYGDILIGDGIIPFLANLNTGCCLRTDLGTSFR